MKSNFQTHTHHQIVKLCKRQYNLTVGIKVDPLPGENTSYRITTEGGQRFVLKLAENDFSSEMIEYENLVVNHLINSGIHIDLPSIIPTKSGDLGVTYQEDDLQLRGRLLAYISGIPWGESGQPSQEQLIEFGGFLGKLDLALEKLDHPVAHRTHQWDLTRVNQHRHKVKLIDDPDRRQTLEWLYHLYAACAIPNLSSLPHSIIHADANDENILLKNGKVSGLLDFGDSIYNPTICELAIAMTYAMFDQADPLSVGALILKGYHSDRPLTKGESAVLFPLICGRLCTTLTIAAERRLISPDHPNWFVSEEPAWRLAENLYNIDPVIAEATLTQDTDLYPPADQGFPPEILLEKRAKHIGPSLSISYDEPLKIVQGKSQYLFDDRGRPYLDLVNNVCHVGHCHPKVVQAGQKQMARLNTNTRYLYDGLTEYAQRLCATLPDPLDTCFFVNSGSEANELALRLAMTHTGRRDFAVVEGAYHGHTSKLIDISPYKFMGEGGWGEPEPWVHIVPMADGYRGIYKGNSKEVGIAYGNEVGRVVSESGGRIAGFITESLMGCGGQIIPPPGYLETAFQHVRSAGGLCIIDEVQVGFARVGKHFWAFELQNVIPDIVVFGKPIGNGHPMAAVITTNQIAASFANGMEFFSTFGGNPVSCAIGLAVLDVIEEESLQQHALHLGTHFKNGLLQLKDKYALIGDVRGEGLFLGIEFVKDRNSLEPAAEAADKIVQHMKHRGVLLSTDGPFHNVIKIKPPMVLNAHDVDMVLRIFDDVLAGL